MSFTAASVKPLISVSSPEVQQRIFKKVEDNIREFGKEHPEFSGFSAASVRPLIREPDMKIKQRVILNAEKLNLEKRLEDVILDI